MTEDLMRRLIEYDTLIKAEVDSPSNDIVIQASYRKHQKELSDVFPELQSIGMGNLLCPGTVSYLNDANIYHVYDLIQLTEQEYRTRISELGVRAIDESVFNLREILLTPLGLDFKEE